MTERPRLMGAVSDLFPMPVARDVPLGPLTSIGFGGPAEYLARPSGVEEAQALFQAARRAGMPLHVMGRGTNLFVDDAGVSGLVMQIGPGSMGEVRVEGARVVAGGGTPLRRLVRTALARGLAGFEPLAGIPGSVGGAIHMNAGTREGDIGAVTAAVTALDPDGHLHRLDRAALAFGYRTSSPASAVVLEAEFDLEPGDPAELRRRVNDFVLRRRRTQPPPRATAGCVFKNPPGGFAGQLIEAAGLKGARIGGMEISPRHANFFVNRGGATFDDARQLIDLARNAVHDAFGVDLELEVEIWRDH